MTQGKHASSTHRVMVEIQTRTPAMRGICADYFTTMSQACLLIADAGVKAYHYDYSSYMHESCDGLVIYTGFHCLVTFSFHDLAENIYERR